MREIQRRSRARTETSLHGKTAAAGKAKRGDGEFLQISSDGFRLAPWTFPEIGSMMTFTWGFAHPVRKRSQVSRVRGSESGGVFRPPKGLGPSNAATPM